MKVWHKDKQKDFGRMLLGWRHRAVGRFIMKIGSWILGAFVMGILSAIALYVILQNAIAAQQGGRITFFVVLIIGIISAFFRHIYYGLYYRICEKALVAVRPFCGFEQLICPNGEIEKAFGTKLEYIPWESIKEVREKDGKLLLVLKEYKEPLKISVAPVRALLLPQRDGQVEKRSNQGGLFGKDISLDKETMRLVLQKIRETKRSSPSK